MITPLPAARPSAFSTVGYVVVATRSSASSRLRSSTCEAVGTPASSISSFANAFEPSSSAAALLGPKAGMPASSRASTAPATSPASGPITAKLTPRACAAATIATASSAATSGRHSASATIPALPGAQRTSVTCDERRSARTIACSRPPPPTTRTFKRLQRVGEILGGHRREGLARHRPPRAELDGDLGHRLLVGSFDHGDEVVLPQRRVLSNHLRPQLFDLAVDLGDSAGVVLQRPHTLGGQVGQHQISRHLRPLQAVDRASGSTVLLWGLMREGAGVPPLGAARRKAFCGWRPVGASPPRAKCPEEVPLPPLRH